MTAGTTMGSSDERVYYSLPYRLDNEARWIIWYSSDASDGVVVDGEKFVMTFASEHMVQQYAERKQMATSQEQTSTLDLDVIATWIRTPHARSVDCVSFLDA